MPRVTRNYCCIDCGGFISGTNALQNLGRCQDCYFIDRKSKIVTMNYCCKSCGNRIGTTSALHGLGLCPKCFNSIPRKISKNYCCMDCGGLIDSGTALTRGGRCSPCAYKELPKKLLSWWKSNPSARKTRGRLSIKLWEDSNYREKLFRTLKFKINKPEKKLRDILPDSFKYTGNGKVFIGRFNPDFIDEKNKKIVELFGDYWHNLPSAKKRDIKRLITYKKHGYRLLIIWEREVNSNIDKVKYKINKFTKV